MIVNSWEKSTGEQKKKITEVINFMYREIDRTEEAQPQEVQENILKSVEECCKEVENSQCCILTEIRTV